MNNYIFTQAGFYVDGQDTESVEERYEKLYHLGFEERLKEAVLKKNARESVQKQKKKGTQYDPVIITGRTIAKSWWGKAWYDNLEKYADFSSRRIMDDEENAQRLFGVL
mgnify:FL=1